MASSSAGTKPPVTATATTATRYMSTSLVRFRPDRVLVSATVTSGASTTARTYPAIWRRG